MSQFAFVSVEFPEVFAHASKAESLALSDARSACFYARLALEVAVGWLYKRDSSLKDPYETTLAARIHEGTFRTLVGSALVEGTDRKGPRQRCGTRDTGGAA